MLLRAVTRTLLVALAAVTFVHAAPAQDWPSKPLRVIVGFAPGGVTDQVARAIQPRLAEGLGQPLIIDNRPGAGGTVAEALLARAAPDGYTIMLTADGVPANPHLVGKLSYDTFKDLTPVSLLVRIPLVLLVNASVPAKNVKEFVDYARSSAAGNISYASPGIGTSNHLYFEVFKDLAKIDMPHVPYKGGGPAMQDLLAGHVQAMFITSTLAVPQLASGKIRALAVTSEQRSPQMPNVPTFAESGYPDFHPQQWTGLFVPAGTPPAIVARIGAEFAKAIKSPDVLARLSDLGAEPVMSSQADFAALLHRDYDVLGKLIRELNIKAQ